MGDSRVDGNDVRSIEEIRKMNAPTKTGPSVKRHKSSGVYRTPKDFITAIERRFGPIAYDLAADSSVDQPIDLGTVELPANPEGSDG